jgi:hypothetical protein
MQETRLFIGFVGGAARGIRTPDPVITNDGKGSMSAHRLTLSLLPRMTPQIVKGKIHPD